MADRVLADIEVGAPVARVWRALRDPSEIANWFGWNHDGLGSEIELIFFTLAKVDEPRHVLDTGDGRLALEALSAEVTHMEVTRATVPAAQPDAVDDGWLQFAHQLRFALERHPGEKRAALRSSRPDPVPDGEPWFRARDDLFGVVIEDGAALLVVEGGHATLSRYGASPAP